MIILFSQIFLLLPYFLDTLEVMIDSSPKLKRPRKWWLLIVLTLVGIIIIAGATAAILLIVQKPATPISEFSKKVNFPLYYPEKLPNGYSFTPHSASIEDNVVFYAIQNGDKKITVSEQTLPTILPNLTAQKFDEIDAEAGKAYIRANQVAPVAILKTNTTLINISASQGTPSDLFKSFVQSLKSIP